MRFYCLILLAVVTTLSSCKTRSSHSSTKDIGIVNTGTATAQVIYSDGVNVFLKTCNPPYAVNLNRNCAGRVSSFIFSMQSYLDQLPYDTARYARTSNGLTFVEQAINLVRDNEQEVARLTNIKNNIVKILQIRSDLVNVAGGPLYSQFRAEASALLTPFVNAQRASDINAFRARHPRCEQGSLEDCRAVCGEGSSQFDVTCRLNCAENCAGN